jgi:hypothetical protein
MVEILVAGWIGEPRLNIERVIEHAPPSLPRSRAATAARPRRERLALKAE